MAALVLGLLVGSAKSSFDSQSRGFQALAVDFILLDRKLAHFGPEAQDARQQLQRVVSGLIESLWPSDGSDPASVNDASITANGNALYGAMQKLVPQNDSQRWLLTQAMQSSSDLARTRWQLAQPNDDSMPTPFLVVLAFWLFVLFTSFGLFAPRNITVVAVLLICAASVAGAVFLVVDLAQPFDGVIRVSSQPLRDAQQQLGR